MTSLAVCEVLGCTNKVHSRGHCQTHYKKLVGTPALPHIVVKRDHVCTIEGCDTSSGYAAKGLCTRHYSEQRRRSSNKQACLIDGCARPSAGQGYCDHHHRVALREGTLDRKLGVQRLCEEDDCNDPHSARGRCIVHYRKILLVESRERTTEYRRAHLPEQRARQAQDRLLHPERYRQYKRDRRAREWGADSEAYTTQDIIELYGSDCHICNESIDLNAPRQIGVEGWRRGLHLDHVIPLVAGGTNTTENVKPAHGECNVRKNASVL